MEPQTLHAKIVIVPKHLQKTYFVFPLTSLNTLNCNAKRTISLLWELNDWFHIHFTNESKIVLRTQSHFPQQLQIQSMSNWRVSGFNNLGEKGSQTQVHSSGLWRRAAFWDQPSDLKVLNMSEFILHFLSFWRVIKTIMNCNDLDTTVKFSSA